MPDTKWSDLPFPPYVEYASGEYDPLSGMALVGVSGEPAAYKLSGNLVGTLAARGGIGDRRTRSFTVADGAPLDVTAASSFISFDYPGWDEANHFYGGDIRIQTGGSDGNNAPGGGQYVYLYGGEINIAAGNARVTGTHEQAVLYGGNMTLNGGSCSFVAGGADAYDTQGGMVRLIGGSASSLDGTAGANGAEIRAGGATASNGGIVYIVGGIGSGQQSGGPVTIQGGNGGGLTAPAGAVTIEGGTGVADSAAGGDVTIRAGHAIFSGGVPGTLRLTSAFTFPDPTPVAIEIGPDGTMGFFDTAPVPRPTGVAVDAAGIHAALVSLGLITA